MTVAAMEAEMVFDVSLGGRMRRSIDYDCGGVYCWFVRLVVFLRSAILWILNIVVLVLFVIQRVVVVAAAVVVQQHHLMDHPHHPLSYHSPHPVATSKPHP